MQKIIKKIEDKTQLQDQLNMKYVDLENMFNIFSTKSDDYIYNLNETLYLYVPKNRLKIFRPDHEMPWTLISFKLYESPRLFWLLIRLNNVQLKDVFKLVKPGDPVYYIDKIDVETILESLIDD